MYGFSTQFAGSYEQAITKVTEELAKEGFGILTEIDVKATLKKKIDVDRKPYVILGACNPHLANLAITAEPDIGLLLPCNVVVRVEEDDSVTVAFMDPSAVLSMVEQPGIEGLAGQVKEKLQRVCAGLAQ
ncbi:DUF302 domain-containing protein [Vibrio vulnificus]|nr:DUF302 domain-containing protein [Vibrio vulnificus]EKA6048688.1 DUF302 domain-containing protein [Vibrio vulnificus]ELB7642428.1 DUF302 domain-containing protein [Vibrio vulnificus]